MKIKLDFVWAKFSNNPKWWVDQVSRLFLLACPLFSSDIFPAAGPRQGQARKSSRNLAPEAHLSVGLVLLCGSDYANWSCLWRGEKSRMTEGWGFNIHGFLTNGVWGSVSVRSPQFICCVFKVENKIELESIFMFNYQNNKKNVAIKIA